MKKITDIIQKAAHPTSVDAKEFFCKTLKEYIHAKYNGIDESADIKKFTEDYHSYLTALERFQDPKSKSAKPKNDSLISNNIKHWLAPNKGISRESILDIAFILADNKSKNGEQIANALLQSMHYPKLHASSELEIFYIYAFLNGLNYTECLKLYKNYLARSKNVFSAIDDTDSDPTSTKFHDELVHITDEEKLFAFVDSKRRHFGTASRKMNGYFSKSFDKMLDNNFKIVIKGYEKDKRGSQAFQGNIDNANRIADIIVEALEIDRDAQKKEKANILNGLKRAQRKIDKEPLTLYIKGKKNAISVYNCISDCGGNVTMRKINRIELKLDFYLFYAGDESLGPFLKNFLKTPPMLYVPSNSKKDEFHAPIDCRRFDHYFIYKPHIFYPIKPISFTSIFNNIDSVLKNEKSFSREGMLLWFLYYYSKIDHGEDHYSLADVNDLICSRYQMLNTADYFDRFIVMLLNFKLQNGRVFYQDEEIDPENVNISNIHELRHSIIRLYKAYFKPCFAVDMFEDKDNITTSLIFKSIKERLGLK